MASLCLPGFPTDKPSSHQGVWQLLALAKQQEPWWQRGAGRHSASSEPRGMWGQWLNSHKVFRGVSFLCVELSDTISKVFLADESFSIFFGFFFNGC